FGAHSGLVAGGAEALRRPHGDAKRNGFTDADLLALRAADHHRLGEPAVPELRHDDLAVLRLALDRHEHAEGPERLLLPEADGREAGLIELRLGALGLLGEGEAP